MTDGKVISVCKVWAFPSGMCCWTGKDHDGELHRFVWKGADTRPAVGEVWYAAGRTVNDCEYGPQMIVAEARLQQPKGLLLIDFLSRHEAFDGLRLGVTRASALYTHFQDQLYDLLDEGNEERLAEVEKIPRETIPRLIAAWRTVSDEANVVRWLSGWRCPRGLARKLVDYYGGSALHKLQDNPYRMLAFVSFQRCDEIAGRLGLAPDDPRRLTAVVQHCLYRQLDHGHTVTPVEMLTIEAARYFQPTSRELGLQAIEAARRSKAIVVNAGMASTTGIRLLEVDAMQHFEQLLADVDLPRQQELPVRTNDGLSAAIAEFEAENGFPLNECQKQAAGMAAREVISILSGGAGVGKTTLLRVLSKAIPGNVHFMALTGQAAKRITLDDFDWRAGTLHVAQTKTRQRLQLPLTDEAGHILTSYIRTGRPASPFRELFLRRKAPHGPLEHTAVHDVLEFRIGRSGLNLPAIGSHALRHSLAVHLLRRGVSTKHIGDVLGHRYPESTAVYLRLAVDDLREVSLPVPQGGTAARLEAADWKSRLPRIRAKVALPLVRTGFHSGLADSLQRYLALRRALGRRYAGEEAVLRRWDDFLRNKFGKVCQVRAEMFHDWAETMPNLHSTVRRNRLRVVRNFLLFHGRQHPNTFIPDLDSFPKPSPSRPPRLVSTSEMAQVLAAASKLTVSHQNALRPQTVRLALMLLFCCGLRRGELLRLQWKDCDLEDDILHIDATKFHKSRLVPMSPSVARTLRQYQQIRQQRNLAVEPSDHLIWSCNPIASQTVYSAAALADNWRFLCLMGGILDERGRPPRLHDLRHSFAVSRLELWYKAGKNLQAKLPYLATYLGHINPVSTHHYLHLTPELQEAANRRFHEYAFRVFAEGGAR